MKQEDRGELKISHLNEVVSVSGGDQFNDKIRQLLLDLEDKSRDHIEELNQVHQFYRDQAVQNSIMKEQFAKAIQDLDFSN